MKRTILGILGCLLLVSSAAALYDLSASTISNSNPGWLIADNGGSQSTITVYVMDKLSSTPVPNADVVFSLESASQDLGTISPATVKTGTDGKATAVFTTLTKSGNATIQAAISVNDGQTSSFTNTTYQRIDHNTPEKASFDKYPSELTAGSGASVNVTVKDHWNNLVDNKNVAESVHITMTGDAGAGLMDGTDYIPGKIYFTDPYGNVSIDLRLSTVAGANTLSMDPIGNIVLPPEKIITGVADSVPWYITQTRAITATGQMSPRPANGLPENNVEITYLLTDKYGNPIDGAPILCEASNKGTTLYSTLYYTYEGTVTVPFGAQDVAEIFTLKASAPGNATALCKTPENVGYCSQNIEYYHTDPVDLIFIANPQSMASLDADKTTRAVLQARVIDQKGNPVKGEMVYFSNTTPTYDGTYVVTTEPALAVNPDVAVLVGDDGYATTEFSPGAFAVYGVEGYNPVATGTIVVTATWTNPGGTITKTRDITLVWKNYPYLSTYSFADCNNAHVGDKLNLTIQLKGDGAALKPDPIDVVLVTDRSGSMMYDDSDQTDRMVEVMNAVTQFIEELSASDKIGLVSFGNQGLTQAQTYSYNRYESPSLGPGIDSSTRDDASYIAAHYPGSPKNYAEYATVDEQLTFDSAAVKEEIDYMVPYSGTPLRDALRKAVQELKSTRARSDSVKAIILLSDGDYNYYGDPLARYANYGRTDYSATDFGNLDYHWMKYSDTDGYQNMSEYASKNGIKIYSIAFSDSMSSDGKTVLETIATSTGGKYYEASSANIEEVYTAIAGDLQETAGGETEVFLDFGTVTIDNEESAALKTYMTYIPEVKLPLQDSSTYINKSNITKFGVYHQLPETFVQDDTTGWNSGTINYDVGTIKLNETWSATLRFGLTKAGTIGLFGPGDSYISFKDADSQTIQKAFIPAMVCQVNEPGVNPGYGTTALRVEDLTVTATESDKWVLAWKTTYDGDKVVTETIQYRADSSSPWQTLPGGISTINQKVTGKASSYTLSIADSSAWKAGTCYQFRVIAETEGLGSVTRSVENCISSSGGTIYIKLE
ncbi:MAG: VWA domain-containing protein [Methanoregula sp.]